MTHLSASAKPALIAIFLLISALSQPLVARADDPIRTRPLAGQVFASEIAAIEALRAHCLEESRQTDAEHVGAILVNEQGQYLVTHGQAEPGQTKVDFLVLRPATTRTVALWHTHGAKGRRTERFSIADHDVVRDTGLPFYLISPSGQISLLVPRHQGLSEDLRQSGDADRLVAYRQFNSLALYRLN